MSIEFVVVMIVSLFAEVLIQRFWIVKMRSLKIEQVTKLYGPCWHEKTKMGTPTMGGIVFIPVLLFAFYIGHLINPDLDFDGTSKIIAYPLFAAAVGFLDDWIKYMKRSSDGLSSLQKLALQIAVTLPWAIWILPGPMTLIPMFQIPRAAGIILLVFTGVGLQNAVNVTDGLDGLVTGCILISMTGALLILDFDGNPALLFSLASAIGISLGFLWHNANPASVFMGDVGSHFFAGLLLSCCVANDAFILIVPLGFMFGIEIISVAIQMTAIHLFKRKVFLMSPIHHHFEMLGWKETQIVARFWIIHAVGMSVCIVAIFTLLMYLGY